MRGPYDSNLKICSYLNFCSNYCYGSHGPSPQKRSRIHHEVTQMPAPGAPADMVMNSTAQWIFTLLHFAVAIGATVWIWRRWERADVRTALLILVGGGLSIVAEPFFDRLGFIWHAKVGQWTAITMFGHSVPLWMLPVYYWFIGGQTIYLLKRMRSGATLGQMLKLSALFSFMDAVLELPILYAGGVYTYFGQQPFYDPTWFPLPAWYIAANGVLPITACAAVVLVSSLGDRRAQWLIPVVIPMSVFAVYASFAWPIWAALNADVSMAVSYLAGTATVVMAVFVQVLLTAVCVRAFRRGTTEAFWPGSASMSSVAEHGVQPGGSAPMSWSSSAQVL